MNAPAKIRVDESTTERAYRHAITIHCPNESEIAMAARVDLATIRDQASIGVSRASDNSATILSEVARLATHAVYADFPPSTLLRIRSALHFTMEAARMIERVSRNG